MTAIRETHDVTTVSHVAANGQWLTVADITAFAEELDLEGIPGDTMIGIQHNPETHRFVLINAVTSHLVTDQKVAPDERDGPQGQEREPTPEELADYHAKVDAALEDSDG